jgi:LytS/YehU family sensor histidine kinase
VENAFKHGISYLGNSFINILLKIDDKQIEFAVENSLSGQTKKTGKESGLGLENTRKRLELLYPGKHQLESAYNLNKYFVKLIIRL